jgi:hypothetical protein
MHLTTRKLFLLVLLLALFTLTAHEIADPDFWWHLRTGQYIFESGTIPHTDIFSFTCAGREWVTHEWLSEIFIYAVYRLTGTGGLVALFSLMMTVAFGISYVHSRQRAVNTYVAGAAMLLGAISTGPIWGVRPQIVSMLLTSVYVALLERYVRGGRERVLWALAPLMLLWVNLHGGYALGLALIILTIIGLMLDGLVEKETRRQIWQRVRPLCLVLFVCLLLVPLNPNGLRMFSYPFETLASPVMQEHIEEWFSPNFHQPRFLPLAVLMFGTFAALALSPKRIRMGELFLLLISCFAVLRSARHLPLFAFVATPLLAEHAWAWLRSQRLGQWLDGPVKSVTIRQAALGYGVLLMAIAVSAQNIRQVVARQSATEAERFPEAAVKFIRAQQTSGPIYNWYDWGGYLIWKLYPERRVYIDGRADVYGDAFISEFLKTNNGETDWREPLKRFDVRTVIVKPNAPLATLLQQESGWTKAFEDNQAVVFLKQ